MGENSDILDGNASALLYMNERALFIHELINKAFTAFQLDIDFAPFLGGIMVGGASLADDGHLLFKSLDGKLITTCCEDKNLVCVPPIW